MSDKARLEVIQNQIKEYNDLLSDHNTLLEVHAKRVNDYLKLKELMRAYLDANADIEAKRYKLKKENKELRQLLTDSQTDCKWAQESLDSAQREVERLIERLIESDLVEGEGG